MAQEASEAVQSGRLNLAPQLHRRAWHIWLDSITDWRVSRQLWSGRRIPVYRRRPGGVGGGCSEEDARRKAVEKEGVCLPSVSLDGLIYGRNVNFFIVFPSVDVHSLCCISVCSYYQYFRGAKLYLIVVFSCTVEVQSLSVSPLLTYSGYPSIFL